jgi:hypothetical protein
MAALDPVEALSTLTDLVCDAPYPVEFSNYRSTLVPRGQRLGDTGVALSSSLSGVLWRGWHAFGARLRGAEYSDDYSDMRLRFLAHQLQQVSERTHEALEACKTLASEALQGAANAKTWRGHAEYLERVLPRLEMIASREGADDRISKISQLCIHLFDRKHGYKQLDETQLRELLTMLPEIEAQVEVLKLSRLLDQDLPLAALSFLVRDYVDSDQNLSDAGLDDWVAALNASVATVAQLHRVLRHQVGHMDLRRPATPDEVTARLEYALESQRGCTIFRLSDPNHRTDVEAWAEGELVTSPLNAARAGIDTVAMRHRILGLDLTYAAIGSFRDGAVLQPKLRWKVERYLFGNETRDEEVLRTLAAELGKVLERMPECPLAEALWVTEQGTVVWALPSSEAREADLAELEQFIRRAADDDSERATFLMRESGLASSAGADSVRANTVTGIALRPIGSAIARHYQVTETDAIGYAQTLALTCLQEQGLLSIVPPDFSKLLERRVVETYRLTPREVE